MDGSLRGALRTPDSVPAGALAVFNESDAAIDFVANGDTSFVLGSAIKHPHDLVMGLSLPKTRRAVGTCRAVQCNRSTLP